MRYFIKNNMGSFTGSSQVLDETGHSVFTVKGRLFSFTAKKTICDMVGTPLFSVKNKLLSLFHKQVYIYDERTGKCLCRVRSPLFGSWRVFDNAIGLDLEGRFFDGIFAYIGGRQVGKFYADFTLSSIFIADAYTLDVYDESFTPFLIALVVGYDNIRDQIRNQASD